MPKLKGLYLERLDTCALSSEQIQKLKNMNLDHFHIKKGLIYANFNDVLSFLKPFRHVYVRGFVDKLDKIDKWLELGGSTCDQCTARIIFKINYSSENYFELDGNDISWIVPIISDAPQSLHVYKITKCPTKNALQNQIVPFIDHGERKISLNFNEEGTKIKIYPPGTKNDKPSLEIKLDGRILANFDLEKISTLTKKPVTVSLRLPNLPHHSGASKLIDNLPNKCALSIESMASWLVDEAALDHLTNNQQLHRIAINAKSIFIEKDALAKYKTLYRATLTHNHSRSILELVSYASLGQSAPDYSRGDVEVVYDKIFIERLIELIDEDCRAPYPLVAHNTIKLNGLTDDTFAYFIGSFPPSESQETVLNLSLIDTEITGGSLVQLAKRVSFSKLDLTGSKQITFESIKELAELLRERVTIDNKPIIIVPALLAEYVDSLNEEYPHLSFSAAIEMQIINEEST